MLYSRILIGLGAAVTMAGPLFALAQLHYDNRVHDFRRSFAKGEGVFPIISDLLLPFAPLGWWSFTSPIAFGVAIAAALRTQWSIPVSGILLALSIAQFLAFRAAYLPYAMLMQVAGVSAPSAYPPDQLLANASLVGVTLGLAIFSVARSIAWQRASRPTTIGKSS